MTPSLTPEQEARFWQKVRKSEQPDGCWIWIAAIAGNGYGNVGINGRNYQAHRIAYALAYSDPGESFVCHTCDVKCCVRPSHLFLGTHQDNMDDAWTKRRMRTEEGLLAARAALARDPRRHARNERHGNAKLTDAQVCEIRECASAGEKHAAIGRRFGIARQSVWRIVTGRARI